MAKKISKKAFQAQYEKYKMLELKASLSAQRLGRMASWILGKDVDAYRCAGGELEIREDEFSIPIRIEDILDNMEED